MPDINIFTSNEEPNELRCSMTSGVLTVSRFCLARNSRQCFLGLAASLPANSIDQSSDEYRAFIAELNEASCQDK